MMNKLQNLMNAAKAGDLEQIKILTTQNGNSKSAMFYQQDALEISAGRGHLPIVKYLVESSAKLGVKLDLDTALIYAVYRGRLNTVDYLVRFGCDPRKDNDEHLKRAARNGHVDVVEYLVGCGCDPRSNNDEALDQAVECGHHKTGIFLVNLGCRLTEHKEYHWLHFKSDLIEHNFWIQPKKIKHAKYRSKINNHVQIKKQIGHTFTLGYSLRKHNFLKFILKPMSLHMQLTSIE
jgi:hypothetical protein